MQNHSSIHACGPNYSTPFAFIVLCVQACKYILIPHTALHLLLDEANFNRNLTKFNYFKINIRIYQTRSLF